MLTIPVFLGTLFRYLLCWYVSYCYFATLVVNGSWTFSWTVDNWSSCWPPTPTPKIITVFKKWTVHVTNDCTVGVKRQKNSIPDRSLHFKEEKKHSVSAIRKGHHLQKKCCFCCCFLSPFNMCTLKLILLPIQREDVGLFSFIRGCDSHGPTGVDPNRSVALGPSRSQAEVLAPTATRVPLPIVLQFVRKLLEYLQSCGPFSALKTYAKGKIMPNHSLWVVGNCVKW